MANQSSQDAHWGSDSPISRVKPPSDDYPSLRDMGGFGFSENGLTFHTSDDAIEEFMGPHFAPPVTTNLEPTDG